MNLQRQPTAITVDTETESLNLAPGANGAWKSGSVIVTAQPGPRGLQLRLSAPSTPIKWVRVKWAGALPATEKVTCDAWERTYGTQHWGAPDESRVMPWYFLATDGDRTNGYGVLVGPKAMCSWRAGANGIALAADVRCGGKGVELGSRTLDVCTVISRPGKAGESAFAAARALCKQMCPKPRLPKERVYGYNDWYYAYGHNSAETAKRDARFIVSLMPKGAPRPYVVIDDGWSPRMTSAPWDRSNEKFPSMPALTAEIKAIGARPGIWIRPLSSAPNDPQSWRLSRDKGCLDPTVPEVRERIKQDIGRLRSWGFEMIKHDFSTCDICGRWGFDMSEEVTNDGWAFADRSKTTAEAITDFYMTIREAAGDVPIIGCNTVSHLAAGIFELQRTGDDTSGNDWGRTKKMGVNTLAFRSPQDGIFYVCDPDCVGLTKQEAVPWAKNRQWMDLVARSNAALFLSLNPDALLPSEVEEVRKAVAIAAKPQPVGEPLNWQEDPYPTRWKLMGKDVSYDW